MGACHVIAALQADAVAIEASFASCVRQRKRGIIEGQQTVRLLFSIDFSLLLILRTGRVG